MVAIISVHTSLCVKFCGDGLGYFDFTLCYFSWSFTVYGSPSFVFACCVCSRVCTCVRVYVCACVCTRSQKGVCACNAARVNAGWDGRGEHYKA